MSALTGYYSFKTFIKNHQNGSTSKNLNEACKKQTKNANRTASSEKKQIMSKLYDDLRAQLVLYKEYQLTKKERTFALALPFSSDENGNAVIKKIVEDAFQSIGFKTQLENGSSPLELQVKIKSDSMI